MILKVLGIVFLVLIVGVVGAGVYFYEFHVFKTVTVCLGERRVLNITCENEDDCLFILDEGIGEGVKNSPDFVREKFDKIKEGIVGCDNFCTIRNVSIVGLGEDSYGKESCYDGEDEYSVEIRGKELVDLGFYYRSKENV